MTSFLVEHEIESGCFEPVGLVEAVSVAELTARVAELCSDLVPGRFRHQPLCGASPWRYLELDADGVVLDTPH